MPWNLQSKTINSSRRSQYNTSFQTKHFLSKHCGRKQASIWWLRIYPIITKLYIPCSSNTFPLEQSTSLGIEHGSNWACQGPSVNGLPLVFHCRKFCFEYMNWEDILFRKSTLKLNQHGWLENGPFEDTFPYWRWWFSNATLTSFESQNQTTWMVCFLQGGPRIQL